MRTFDSNNIPLYNSRIIDTYIKLIKRKYSYVNLNDLFTYAKMKSYEVADQGHWFTQEQVDLFYERLVKLTGNDKIAHEAGRYSASPEAIGVMRQYVLGLVSPAKVYELVGKTAPNFTKSSIYESKILASNKVEINVKPIKGVCEKPFQCENRIGFMEAIAEVFNNKLLQIEHPECMFKGGVACTYIISWEKNPLIFWKIFKNYSILVVIAAIITSLVLQHYFVTATLIPILTSLILIITLVIERIEKKELKQAIDNVRYSTDNLLEQINVNYNNALITNEIGQTISKHSDVDVILEKVIQILNNRLDYDRGMILLANDDKTKLIYRTGFGYSQEQAGYLNKASFHLDRPESKGVFVVSFREQKPFLINDLNEIESTLSSNSLAFARKLGSQSFICCPIICDGESLGILAVDNLETKKPLIQSDMSLLTGIAQVIGISIHNANLIEARVRQFSSILQVMAASIDARDNLTAGHSAKVTEYSMGICNELGLSSEYREMIRVASLLHDYGKIGVPDSILKKPGRLTAEEHNIVKSHAAKTREILEQINFEGIYRQVPEIAGSHHEKVDGTGYPCGLKGKDISIGAKIIAVADFFEAITAERHYRDPMPIDVALQLLRDGVGKHFEEKIVNAFISHLRKKGVCPSEEAFGRLIRMDRPPKRMPCSIPVTVHVNGKIQSGNCIDMSLTGIYVEADLDIRTGDELIISIAFPGICQMTCNAKSKVAWVNSREERRKPSLPPGFGAEFIELDTPVETIQFLLDSYASENWRYDDKKPANERVS